MNIFPFSQILCQIILIICDLFIILDEIDFVSYAPFVSEATLENVS